VRDSSLGPHAAYVKVAEGCDRRCAFCTVPQIRGRQRSRLPKDVIAEMAAFRERGVREINLVAQDLSAYGQDLSPPCKLRTLIEALVQKWGRTDFWLRCLYLYPSALTPGLLRTLQQAPFVVPYLDVPLQHVDDRVLGAMQRGYGGRTVERLMERIRRDWPQAAVRTTFLVGHPGETTAAFARLRRFVERWRLDHVGVFAFSPEEGTAACTQKIAPHPRNTTAQRRRDTLMALQRDISRTKLARLRGQVVEVLIEGASADHPHIFVGRHAGQAPEVDGKVYITEDRRQADGAPRLPCGARLTVEIIDSGDYDLIGVVIGAPDGGMDGAQSGPAPLDA
jgi:ribosomal protein S12 methylthiotransferase